MITNFNPTMTGFEHPPICSSLDELKHVIQGMSDEDKIRVVEHNHQLLAEVYGTPD